jgi:hypothetical protein
VVVVVVVVVVVDVLSRSGRPELIEKRGLVSSSFRRVKIDDALECSFYM